MEVPRIDAEQAAREERMIKDEELVDMIRASATEQLPIAVMTVKEMRQFAQKVAAHCVRVASIPYVTKKDFIQYIRKEYDLK